MPLANSSMFLTLGNLLAAISGTRAGARLQGAISKHTFCSPSSCCHSATSNTTPPPLLVVPHFEEWGVNKALCYSKGTVAHYPSLDLILCSKQHEQHSFISYIRQLLHPGLDQDISAAEVNPKWCPLPH